VLATLREEPRMIQVQNLGLVPLLNRMIDFVALKCVTEELSDIGRNLCRLLSEHVFASRLPAVAFVLANHQAGDLRPAMRGVELRGC